MVELAIDRVDRPGLPSGKSALPGVAEADVISVAAFGARAVASGQGSGFVEEEELRPAAGLHQLAVATAELEATRDPAADLAVANDPLLGIVQDAAVAGEEAAARHGHDVAERGDAITARHSLSRVLSRAGEAAYAKWGSDLREAEQRAGVVAANLLAIELAQGQAVEPVGLLLHALVRIVN